MIYILKMYSCTLDASINVETQWRHYHRCRAREKGNMPNIKVLNWWLIGYGNTYSNTYWHWSSIPFKAVSSPFFWYDSIFSLKPIAVRIQYWHCQVLNNNHNVSVTHSVTPSLTCLLVINIIIILGVQAREWPKSAARAFLGKWSILFSLKIIRNIVLYISCQSWTPKTQ